MHAPLLEGLTLTVMLLVGLLQLREGFLRAFLLLVNVLLAGLLAFNFWEPLAQGIEALTDAFAPYADALTLTLLFCLILAGLRWLTTVLAPQTIALPRIVQRVGGVVCGLAAGYVASGILICILQTLPWDVRFLGYDPDAPLGLGAPDRLWLATVHRSTGVVFDLPGQQVRWFDADGSFIPRYARYRRTHDGRVEHNQGEFPDVLPVVPPD